MLKLNFSKPQDTPLKVLCLGAHCDDIEIGCGGTVLKLLENNPNTYFYWVVFSSNEQRKKEATKSASAFLQDATHKQIIVKDFRNSFFPYVGAEIKEYFEMLKNEFSADLIFTHYRNDLHQDHRLISELTWNTFRKHLILEYEVIKYDGDLGTPNFFIHLDEKTCQEKINHIVNCFRTQGERNWFTQDTFLSLLRLRGIESNAPEKYAEAYYCRKIVFSSYK